MLRGTRTFLHFPASTAWRRFLLPAFFCRRSAMNEADFPSINLDELRLVPDWMREGAPSPSKQYAGHTGPSDRELRPDSRGPRPGSGWRRT